MSDVDVAQINLRQAKMSDCKKLWEWRNHPQVRKNFFNDQVVAWDVHREWFIKKLGATNVKIYIAEYEGAEVGVIRFQINEHNSDVSVNVDPQYFGMGLGTGIIELGTKEFLKEPDSRLPVTAEIKEDNIISQKAFGRAGYRMREEDFGKVIYEKCAE